MHVRKAKMSDVAAMFTLISTFAQQGLLLPRSLQSLYEDLQLFSVVEADDGSVVGVAGLHILWSDLAEIRSLAIAPAYQGTGLGSQLVNHLIDKAYQLEIARVLALTYQVSFFKRIGFSIVTKESLPQKVWKDCVNCPKFATCDEVALLYQIPVEAQNIEPFVIPTQVRTVV
ncbi:MAG: acetyltransferase [Bacilli bacterium]|nr:acetyltransferase [Bacilli bacterium]